VNNNDNVADIKLVPVRIENTELTYRMERMWRLLFEDATEGAGNLDPTVVCAPTLPPCWNFVAREGILGDIAGYASIDVSDVEGDQVLLCQLLTPSITVYILSYRVECSSTH
jgi:hypothetical protein